MENRPAPLRSRRVCRFCLTESEPLSYIYERDHSKPFQVPLTLQIMSCVAIEVYAADGMPQMICSMCRWNLDRSYKFKLQCKKADEALRDYPLSGVLPRPFPPIPNDPPEMCNKRPAEARQQNEGTKKPRIDNSERERRVTREREREREREQRERERERDRDRQNEKEKSSSEQHHDFYEEEQDGGSEGEQESGSDRVKSDPTKLEPGEIRVHACDQCDRTFPLRQALALHIQNAHRDRNYKCTECERMFFTKYDLNKHMTTHSEEKPYSCQICQKQFSRQNLLHRHEKVHRDEARYNCQHCDREFFTTEDLEKHEDAMHKKDKPFQCNICNKRFQYKQGLERHETLHNEDKTFVCEYCKEAFHTSTKLARHLTSHAGHRPYMCKLCPRTFLLSHHLTRHMRTHSVEKRHVCEDCGKAFKRKESLEVHQLTHTKRTPAMGLTCDVCQESCRNRADYVTHIKQHIEAGEKMGPDGLQPDNKSKEIDSEEEEEEEEQYSDGDDDYEPPAYVIKKMPKPVIPRQEESDEEEDDEQQRKEQVVFVRGKDGNMVKKTIKTLMPIQRREVQEQKPVAKQSPGSGSSASQSGAKSSASSQSKEESPKSVRDDTDVQVQKIVASVFKEHKIPLKHQNIVEQPNKESPTAATTGSQAATASQEARKADDKADGSATETAVPGTMVTSTPKGVNTVKVIKRFVLRKPSGNAEGTNTNVQDATVSNPSGSGAPNAPTSSLPKVNRRLIVRRIIRHGDTTREVIMNPDGTAVDPAELAKLPTGNVVKRVVVKAKGPNLVQALLQRVEQHQKTGEAILDDTTTSKFELKTASSNSGASTTAVLKTTVASQKPASQQQSSAQEDQETKEKLERLEKRVEQQRLKIEELQARKQEYDAIDEMLPERHDESEDEQQLPLKRVFVKRKQSIYDEEQEYNDNETETKPTKSEQQAVIKSEEAGVEETPENIQKEIQKEMQSAQKVTKTTTTVTAATTSSSTPMPKKGPTISSEKVYTNRRYLIMKPDQTSEVEEMSRELCSILETTENVVKMQETVLSNLTQISGTIATDITAKPKSENSPSAGTETAEQQAEAIEVDSCDTMATIREETAMEVEVASQELKLDSSEEVVEETDATEGNHEETEETPHLALDTQDLSETGDIFETSDDVLDVQKSSTLNDSVMELSQTNETINLNDTNDSQDSLEDKLSQMEG
ncbi:PREDICTED: uncharacterized protein LOC106746195 [Dinoponera quadriceps]|uniref:Uncharacterized protein LOC106746195 n=1 Tax=Dinoponera quadriceps TaxID=609295 RepID=A0A6P3XHP0_DINQU|nr:PREDICTED: uncharacterized protein LOC106746195 [Dinoponera quadriceps]